MTCWVEEGQHDCAPQPVPLPAVAEPCARKKSFLKKAGCRQAPMLQGGMREPHVRTQCRAGR